MALKLTRIDDLTRGEHYYLDQNDVCYFFGEYTSRQGFTFSETNQLILNFKKPMSVKGTAQWQYKTKAIQQVSELFRSVSHTLPAGVILVPAPPSKAPNDPMYDDRMHQALTRPPTPIPFEVRRLIVQSTSRKPSHACADGERPKVEELVRAFSIDESLVNPSPPGIIVCDDVLTNGTTFKAMKYVLQNRFPGVPVAGIFVARRALGSDSALSAEW